MSTKRELRQHLTKIKETPEAQTRGNQIQLVANKVRGITSSQTV